MKEETAKQVLDEVDKADVAFRATIEIVRNDLPKEEFEAFVLQVGEVMTQHFERFIVPIYKKYPSLAPDWYKKPVPKKDANKD